MEYFVFGEVFKWDDVTIMGFNPISLTDAIPFTDCSQKDSNQYRHLRYLKIDGLKIFSSICGISTNSLKIIGDQLIYNESSMLEELCLVNCNLKIHGLKALTSGA